MLICSDCRIRNQKEIVFGSRMYRLGPRRPPRKQTQTWCLICQPVHQPALARNLLRALRQSMLVMMLLLLRYP